MKNEAPDMRVGHGYDAHRLAPGRRLVLGGVEIPYEKGLAGHSDADVLVHAIMDALLGAAGLGDIGVHFPDSDPAYKDAGSLRLLTITAEKIRAENFEIANVDSTIIAEAPKLAPYFATMRNNIAVAAGLTPDRVNVKATTEEGMGFTGAKEGIAAAGIALLIKT
jgi:2-C-methyl-D-erythritol 2,4-cyclodiphosphate synthase